MRDVLSTLDLNTPADDASIGKAQRDLGCTLPSEYVEFLKTADGAEGAIGMDGYVQLWRVEDLQSLNQEYAVDEFAPGFVLFGSNGGGTGYAFDQRNEMAIFHVPLGALDRNDSVRIAQSFWSFLEELAGR